MTGIPAAITTERLVLRPFRIGDIDDALAYRDDAEFARFLPHMVIGTMNFEVDAATHTAMIGYAIGRAWWGRGMATEAVLAAMAWAIDAFGLVRRKRSAQTRRPCSGN
jgi:ribosomal-protein-alanine N-acetyltransferase